MQIKKFEARDMAAALRKVKKEFGEQAVILSAKTLKQPGGIFGTHRRKGVEITAASDPLPTADSSAAPRFKAVLPAAAPDPANLLGRELPVNPTQKPDPSATADQTAMPTAAPTVTTPLPAAAAPASSARTPSPGAELAAFKRALLAQDVSDDLATQMVHRVTRDLEVRGEAVDIDLNRRFQRLLNDQLHFARADRSKKGGPWVIALVGPTGVGKSTTAAKLAARFSAKEGARVGLISLDHQRIGGTAQLEVLAQVMKLPLVVIKAKSELKAALAEMKSCDIILVDTPGVSVNCTQDLKKLSQMLTPLHPNETHLLLSATTKDRDLHLLAEQFNRVGYNRLIFTKLDETAVYGNLLNLMTTNQTPLAYLTDGPKVPDGLKTATAASVIELFTPHGASTDSATGDSGTAAAIAPPKSGNSPVLAAQQDYFVANRNSDIFHQPDCKAAKRINPENILVFKNMGEAKSQNFKPCRMCCAMRLSRRPAFETFRLKAVAS
ncbi:MAG: flagellar biosynthesis protein FlhF [Desulfosarcinaceae bacterium]|nr:flagellar biosynthesis protein FlhF [Desulfosarcinaceae bacterium]